MMDSPEDIAKMDREDAARERITAMQLKPFEYVKPDGKKKIKVIRFQRMYYLLWTLTRSRYWDQVRDFTDEEIAGRMQQSVATMRRASDDCVGRGLLKVDWLANIDPGCGSEGVGKRRYEIQWDEVDRANPDLHDPIGLDWLP
jgi:hypothetical protein